MKSSIAALVLFLATATPAIAANLQADLMAREKAGWTAWGAKDATTGVKGMAEDIVQVIAGVGRVEGKQAVAAATASHDCVMRSFEFHDPALRQITPDVAILSYRATQDTTCGAQTLPKSVLVTVIYVHRGDAWLSTSYQETPAE